MSLRVDIINRKQSKERSDDADLCPAPLPALYGAGAGALPASGLQNNDDCNLGAVWFGRADDV